MKAFGRRVFGTGVMVFVLGGWGAGWAGEDLPEGLFFEPGPVNRVTVEREGKTLGIYGAPEGVRVAWVLLTDGRRDVVWAAREAAAAGAKVAAPLNAQQALAKPEYYWRAQWDKRFRDSKQEMRRVPTTALPVDRWVGGGEVIAWEGLKFRVLDSPGYAPEAVTYLTEIDGQRVAFTGDLIYQGGRLYDLYSLQNPISEARVGGYHGYAGRMGDLIVSLEAVAAAKPDLIVPARGPLIAEPAVELEALVKRLRAIYRLYLSTNALHWYFGEERMDACAALVFGEGETAPAMAFSEHVDLPDWIISEGTTKIILAEDGHGFMLDCGSDKIFEAVKARVASGEIAGIDGIYVTHYHSDHTLRVQAAAEFFGCPIYADEMVADVLLRPGAYRLPALIGEAMGGDLLEGQGSGTTMEWKGYRLTFEFFPGQTYYHGALLVERAGHEPVMFVGDSFTPSGIDDYCLMNRNLIGEDTGYLYCLRRVGELPAGSWLVNQHLPHLFRFTEEERLHLEKLYRERAALLADLFPWDGVNYGIDEQWARIEPYGVEVAAGETVSLEVVVMNHSPEGRDFTVTVEGETRTVTVGPGEEGRAGFEVAVPAAAVPGSVRVVTADLRSGDDIDVRRWCEALIRVPD